MANEEAPRTIQEALEKAAEIAENSYHRADDSFKLPGRTEPAYSACSNKKWSEPFRPYEIAGAIRQYAMTLPQEDEE